MRLARIGQILVPGLYAWAVTVVPSTTHQSTAGWWPSVAAFVALVSLSVGAFFAHQRPQLGYALGIWGFVLACLSTWLLNMPALQIERLDPWRAGAGSIGWILFSLGWGTPWRVGGHPEDNPRANLYPKLEPHRPPRLGPALAVLAATIGALACMLLAWRASDPNRGLLLHGAALACSVAMIHSAVSVGLAQGAKRTAAPTKQRITYAFPWVMAISALVVIAFAWMLGR